MSKEIDVIKHILDILKEMDIEKNHNLTSLVLDKGSLLSAQRYPWIGDIAESVNFLYYNTEKHIGDIDGQLFLIDKVETPVCQDIIKYSCIFPDRTILSSGDFFYLDKKEFAFIDIDFFKKLFWCKDLLLEGIVHISPFYLRTDIEEGMADYENCMIEQLNLPNSNKNKIAELDDCGFGTYKNDGLLNKLYVSMPWLQNVHVSDYLDIVTKYRTEFELYNRCLSHISDITEDTDAFIKKYLNDYKDATINLQIAMEKKQAEFKTKGILTVVSLCLTAIPYFMPSEIIDPRIMTAFLGTGTVKELLSSANICTEKNRLGRDDPFWVLWKWKNSF